MAPLTGASDDAQPAEADRHQPAEADGHQPAESDSPEGTPAVPDGQKAPLTGAPDGAPPASAGGGPPGPAAPGVADLYRAVADVVTRRLDRRAWIAIEAVLIAAFALMRTADLSRGWFVGWYGAVALITLLSPVSGLVLVAAVTPFSERVIVDDQLGFNALLVAALGVAVAPRILLRPRTHPFTLAVALGGLLGIGTLAGVLVTWRDFGEVEGFDALELWLAGVGGAMIILIAAAWIGRVGALRPVWVAVGSASVAGVISLVEFLNADLVRGGPFDWMVRAARTPGRLSGVIPSPNGVAALVIIPTAVLLAFAVLAKRRAIERVLAAALAGVLILALYFTYSRSPLIGLFIVAVVIAWRIRRAAGAAVLVVGGLAGAVLFQRLFALRDVLITGGNVPAGGVTATSDRMRLDAWTAAIRMWLDAPLTGHGYRAYGFLAPQFGDQILKSPHNEWLRLFAEGGILVGLTGIAFVVATSVSLSRVHGWLGAGILSAFLGWVAAASFNNPLLFLQVSGVAFAITGTGLAMAATAARQGVQVPASGHDREPIPGDAGSEAAAPAS